MLFLPQVEYHGQVVSTEGPRQKSQISKLLLHEMLPRSITEDFCQSWLRPCLHRTRYFRRRINGQYYLIGWKMVLRDKSVCPLEHSQKLNGSIVRGSRHSIWHEEVPSVHYGWWLEIKTLTKNCTCLLKFPH